MREPAAQEPQNSLDTDDPGDVPDLTGVPAGTHLPLVIVRAPQESQAREGDKVYLRTRVPVHAGGREIIPARTLVVGVLTSESGAGAGQAHGMLSLRLRTIVFPDNERFALSGRVPGVVNPSRSTAGAPLAAGIMPSLTAEQLAIVGSFAAVGGAIGTALGKDSKGATVGTLVGAGIGVATVMASTSRSLHLTPGTNVDAVLDQPLALEQAPNQ
ncbi:MAG TPA: hypothetical protein VJX29_07040 [Candidatus Acidoferrales bacterium]|nr:hypothetical protein [Candidatus Acidoferrales bacterium]